MNKALAAALLVACSLTVHAQTAKPSKAKQDLIAKVLELQRPVVENQARVMAEQPAAVMLQRAAVVVQQRLPVEKREPLLKELQSDARQYAEEVGPHARAKAAALLPTTIGAVLDAKFSEADLKKLLTILQDPVLRKFEQAQPDMSRAMGEKLVPEMKPLLEPKIKALEQTMGRKLEAAVAAAAPAGAASATKP